MWIATGTSTTIDDPIRASPRKPEHLMRSASPMEASVTSESDLKMSTPIRRRTIESDVYQVCGPDVGAAGPCEVEKIADAVKNEFNMQECER